MVVPSGFRVVSQPQRREEDDLPAGFRIVKAPAQDDGVPPPFFGIGDPRNPELPQGERRGLQGHAREAMLGAQGIGSGLLQLGGGLYDLAALPQNLAAGASNRFLGTDIPMATAFGSANLQRVARETAEGAGVPVVRREDMTPGERTYSTALEMATQAPAAAAAFVRGTAAGRGAGDGAAMGMADRTRPVSGLLQDLGAYYNRAPARAYGAEIAGGAGAGAAMQRAQELDLHPVLQFGAGLLGGFTGAGVADIATGGLPAIARGAARQMTPADEITRDPATGMRPTQSVESQAAARLQQRAVDPERAAMSIEQRQQVYRDLGITPPDTFLMSRDPGLLAEGRGQRAISSTPFMERDIAVRQGAAEAVAGLERGAPAERFTEFAGAERTRRIADADQRVEAAQTNLQRVESDLSTQQAQFALRSTGQEGASARLQSTVLDDVLFPMQAERASLYDAITNTPEARTVRINPAPLRQAMREIRQSQGELNLGTGVPSQLMQRLDRASDSGNITYRDIALLRPELSAARQEANLSGNVALSQNLDRINSAIRQIDESLASQGGPLGENIRAALDFDRNRVFRYFGDPQNRAGLQVREAANVGEFGRGDVRRGQESFAREYFFGAQANPAETARDLREMLSIAPQPEAGIAAARDYLIASAARTVDRGGNINANRLQQWVQNNREALSQFPEAERELLATLRRLQSGEGAVTQAQRDMQRIARDARRTQQEIDRGWIGLVLGGSGQRSPQNAARAILASDNPNQVARQILRDIRQFGNAEVEQAFRNSVSRHLADRVTTNAIEAAGGANPVSYAQFMNMIRRSDGAIQTIYRNDPEAQKALMSVREALEDMQFMFARVNPGGSDTMQNMSERLISAAELPVRAQFGHLRGGGIMRTLRLYVQRVPGMDNSQAVTDLIARAAFDPEIAKHLLRRPPDGNTVSAERQRVAWITKLRSLLTAGQAAGAEDDNDRLQ